MILDNFPHLCKITKSKTTRGGMGSSKTARKTLQEDVACWDQAASSSEILEFAKRGMRISHKVYFRTDPGIREHYFITITSRHGTAVAAASQREMEVISESRPDATAGMSVAYKVMVLEKTGDDD